MEPKVIGVISNNLEIVRKVVEHKEETTKKVFKDIINGDDVKSIVNMFVTELEDIKNEVVKLQNNGGVKEIVKKAKSLMGKKDEGGNKALLEVLNKISDNVSSILGKMSGEKSSDLKDMFKNDDTSGKKNYTKILLQACTLGKDIGSNLADIKKHGKDAKKGIKILDEILFV